MSDCSSFQQTFSLLQVCLGLIMCLHFIRSHVCNNARSCWCCSRIWINLQKLNRATIWKNGRLARTHLNCPFLMGEGFKGKHWNRESHYTWNHLVLLTKFSIFKSGSSIYHSPHPPPHLFFLLQDIQYRRPLRPPGSQRRKVSMWPQRPRLAGQSRYWPNCFRLSETSLPYEHSLNLYYFLSFQPCDTNSHFPLPQTWTCTNLIPHKHTHTHTHLHIHVQLKLSYTLLEKMQRIKIYCDIGCSCWTNPSVHKLFYMDM